MPRGECRPIFLQLSRLQCRSASTLASIADNETSDFVIQPPPRILPVQPLRIPNSDLREKEEGDKSTLHTPVENFRRCNGFRKYDGQRCERLVRTDPSLPLTDQVLCFNHNPHKKTTKTSKRKQSVKHKRSHVSNINANPPVIIKASKIFEAPAKVYDCWNLWIGEHIKKEQSNLIRQEMEKPISERDKPGFIYAYSLSQGPRASKNKYAYFKIGRTTDPHRRMYQVSNICKMEPKIIELFPSFPINTGSHVLPTNLHALEKKLEDVPKCPLSHRVERLIHLELSGIYKRAGFKCPQCGSTHREWIRINRGKHADGRPMTDHELWLSNIRPVILKWVKYGVVASAVKNSSIQ